MRIIIILLALTLSACGILPPPRPQAHFDTRGYPTSAWNEYNVITDARTTVSVRAPYLDWNSPLVEGLRDACRKGLDVSVILHVGGRRTASAVAGTCVRVYFSDYPALQANGAVILTDGIILTVNGTWVAANNRTTIQEYRFQQQQKMMAMRAY